MGLRQCLKKDSETLVTDRPSKSSEPRNDTLSNEQGENDAEAANDDVNDELEERRERRLYRLEQNRKSAHKCRLKKKAEYHEMSSGVSQLRQENKELQA